MAEPIKIRATLLGEQTEIRILMQHPMETGLRKDPASGQIIAAHFIQTFTVSANGKLLIEGSLEELRTQAGQQGQSLEDVFLSLTATQPVAAAEPAL